ncbi:ErfK/YbiS/YcfS/YnhG family protein [Thalassoporum mexicanum PCC 7367]|nr:ErfK/YbiS/YcfS/YnhG family protein [Pseudanabaena sp. PCC 7367]
MWRSRPYRYFSTGLLSLLLTISFGAISAPDVPAKSITQSTPAPGLAEPNTIDTNPRLAIETTNQHQIQDLKNHWAEPFVQGLVSRRLINIAGKNFRPNATVTRAELAVLLQQAFIYQPQYRNWVGFDDIPADHWAAAAIQKAFEGGFISGFADRTFRPNQTVTKAQALVAIANGMDLVIDPERSNQTFLASMYVDAFDVPDYAIDPIAALTDRGVVVNYPRVRNLNPDQNITRAELVAIIYQSLAYQGGLPPLDSAYVIDPRAPLFDLKDGQVITKLEVNLSQRQVSSFQGDRKVKSYPVGVGRIGWETPTGTYQVRQMYERPAWKNPFTGDVIPGGDPDNPLGKYWIGFWTNGKDWSGFHGTPNRNSVGQAVSHGCIRMYNEDIAELFSQVSPATVVQVIH